MNEKPAVSDAERFRAAVRNQAEARAEMDFQGFLGYFLPEAMAGVRAAMGGRSGRPAIPRPGLIEGFDILEQETEGDSGRSTVRYSGYGSFVLKQEWRKTKDGWRVVKMVRPPEMAVGPTLVQRIKRLPQMFSTVRMSRPPGGMRPGGGMGPR